MKKWFWRGDIVIKVRMALVIYRGSREAKPRVPTNSRPRIRTQASNLSIWLWHQLSSGRSTHVSWASVILAGKWECAHLRRLWWRLRQMHLCVQCTEHLFTRDDYCPHYHGKDVLQGYWIFWNAPGRSTGRYFGFEFLQYPRELFLLPLKFCEKVLSLTGWTNSFKCTLKWFRKGGLGKCWTPAHLSSKRWWVSHVCLPSYRVALSLSSWLWDVWMGPLFWEHSIA